MFFYHCLDFYIVLFLVNILMMLFCFLAFSQFTEHKLPGNEWDIYPETNIHYSNGKEDLKEILTLQSLLAEDRIDEMFEMMGKFGYMPIPNNKNVFCILIRTTFSLIFALSGLRSLR